MKTIDNVKKRIITSMLAILLLILTLLGITYAYFIAKVKGNPNDESISVKAGFLELTYEDGNGILNIGDNLVPGSKVNFKTSDDEKVDYKTFTVTNTGTRTVESYEVILENVINELDFYEDLTYDLSCESYINYGTIDEEKKGNCNNSNGVFPKTDGVINSNSIDTGVTHFYKLTMFYKETHKDQSNDMKKNISAKINIQDNESALKNLIVYGNSIQEGTPTLESPIEIISVGDKTRNLIKESKTERKNQTYPITVEAGTYVAKVYNDDLSSTGIIKGSTYAVAFRDENNNNIVSGVHNGCTITEEQASQITKVVFSWNDAYYSGNSDYIVHQLEEGNDATDYEPYGYKIPVKVGGKNILNPDSLTQFDKQADGSYLSNTTIHVSHNIIQNLKGIYTISAKIKSPAGKNYRFRVWYTDGTYTDAWKDSTGEYLDYKITTNGKDIERIAWHYSNGSNEVYFKDFQIEVGSVATEYKKYYEPITTSIYLDEPLRKVGEYVDYIDFYNNRVVRYVAVADDSGTKTIEESFYGLPTPTQTNINLPTIGKKEINSIEVLTTIQPSKIEY